MKKSLWAFFSTVLFFSLIFLVEASCSKGNLVPSEDGLRVREMDHVIETLRTSYIKKDPVEFLKYFSQEDANGALILEKNLDHIFVQLDPVTLKFFIEKVILQEAKAKAYIHWQGKWQRKEKGTVFSKKGDMVFLFEGKKEPLVLGIEGDSPFELKKLRQP